jgi:transposase
MRFAGIDIASETHVVAMVGADGLTQMKSTPFAEDATGYDKLLALLGAPSDVLVAMEATGHYWKNLFARPGRRRLPRGAAQSVAHASLRARGPRAHQNRCH